MIFFIEAGLRCQSACLIAIAILHYLYNGEFSTK